LYYYPSDQYGQIIKSKLAAEDVFDLFQLHASNELPEFVEGGFIEPLNETTLIDVLYDGSKASVTFDGNLYGLPLESMNWAMLYNKQLFDELGIKPADTLSELKEVSQKIKDAGKTPFLISYQESWIPQLFLPLIVGSVDSKNGFIDKMNAGKSSFSDIKNDFFGVIDIVHANGNVKAFEFGGTSGCAEFATGNYGMWIMGPWFAETILDVNKDMKFGVAAIPVNENKELTQIMQAITTTLVISKKSENKALAKAFLEYLISAEVANQFYEELKFNPVAKTQNFDVYPWVEDSIKYIEERRSYTEKKIPQSVKDESGILLQEYYSKKKTKDEVLSALDKEWETYNKVNR
jgi:raffinose/stachyose/melibiose transport system substrate-binding protein